MSRGLFRSVERRTVFVPGGFRSAKAVITAPDSGGPSELVRDGANGLVATPEPVAIAERLDALADASAAESLGQQALRDAGPHTWGRAIAELTL